MRGETERREFGEEREKVETGKRESGNGGKRKWKRGRENVETGERERFKYKLVRGALNLTRPSPYVCRMYPHA